MQFSDVVTLLERWMELRERLASLSLIPRNAQRDTAERALRTEIDAIKADLSRIFGGRPA